MSPDKREKFAKKLKEVELKDAEDRLIRAMMIIEMELNAFIDDKYPLLKLYEQLEEYSRYSEEVSHRLKTRR